MKSSFFLAATACAALTLAQAGLAATIDAHAVRIDGRGLSVAGAPAAALELRLSGPGGLVTARTFAAGESVLMPFVDERGQALPDGEYVYELRVHDGGPARSFRAQAGGFRLSAGQVLLAPTEPPTDLRGGATDAPEQDVLGDLRVTGNLCTGSANCPTLDFFGVPLVVDNALPRILLRDTVAPDNDWVLEANTSSNQFAVIDDTANNIPFVLRAGAPNFSLYVDAIGRLGLGTATPETSLDIVADEPQIRLQDTNDGRIWRMSVDNVYFGLADLQGGGTPFRIRNGAPSNSIVVNDVGNVGLGQLPAASLHLRRSDGTARLQVEETNGAALGRNLVRLINNGGSTFRFDNTASGAIWGFGSTNADAFFLSRAGSPSLNFALDGGGNLTISGALTQMSDRNVKTDIAGVDPQDVLARVAALEINTWRYRSDAQARHLGPMAQDFAAAFGLGADDRHLSPADVAGVALAAIQALERRNGELQRRLEQLEARVPAE